MSTDTPKSNCCNAPIVTCEGRAWDVPPESIKPGATYYFGCTECKEVCDAH